MNVPNDSKVEIDKFCCKSGELIINAHTIVASSWWLVLIIRVWPPLIRMHNLSIGVSHSKPSHAITPSQYLKENTANIFSDCTVTVVPTAVALTTVCQAPSAAIW